MKRGGWETTPTAQGRARGLTPPFAPVVFLTGGEEAFLLIAQALSSVNNSLRFSLDRSHAALPYVTLRAIAQQYASLDEARHHAGYITIDLETQYLPRPVQLPRGHESMLTYKSGCVGSERKQV